MTFLRRGSWLRRLGLGVLVLAVLGVACLALAHTAPARAAVLRLAVRQMEGLGLVVRTGPLRYNLFRLHAEIAGLEVASALTPGEPFLAVDRLAVSIPWRSLVGDVFVVQSLAVNGPRVDVRRSADGRFNLPVFEESPETGDPPAARPFVIRELSVQGLALRYTDEAADLEAALDGVSLGLSTLADGRAAWTGEFEAQDGGQMRVGSQTTRVSQFEGEFAYDGSALLVEDVHIEAPEGDLLLSGRLDFAAAPALDLRVSGSVNLDRLSPWMAAGEPASGHVLIEGRASGPLADLEVAWRLSGNGLAWRGLEDVEADVAGLASVSGVLVDAFWMRAAGGEIEGRGLARFGAGGPPDVEGEFAWRNLDTAILGSAFAGETPVTLASRADGTAAFAWPGGRVSDADAAMSLVLRPLPSAGGGLPIAGRADFSLAGGAWSLVHDHTLGAIRLAGSAKGRLDPDDPLASPAAGRAIVTVVGLAEAARTLTRAGVDLPAAVAAGGLAGRGDAALTWTGAVGDPAVEFSLVAEDLVVGPAGPARLRANGLASRERVSVASLEFTDGPNRIEAAGQFRLESGTVDARLAADLPDIGLLAAGLPPGWRPSGALTAEMTVGGTAGDPRVAGRIDAQRLSVAGQTAADGTLTFALSGGVVSIDRMALSQPEGRLSASGRYDPRTGHYAVEAVAENWAFEPVPGPNAGASGAGAAPGDADAAVPVRGRLDLRLDARGSGASPAGALDVSARDVEYGASRIGSASLGVEIADGLATVRGALPDLRTRVQGTLVLEEPRRFTAAVHVDRVDLERIAALPAAGAADPASGEPLLTGALALSADVTGELDDLDGAVADLQIALLDAQVGGRPLTLDRPASLRYRAKTLSTRDDIHLRLGETELRLGGRFGQDAAGELRAGIDGSLADLIVVANQVAEGDFDGDGRVSAEVILTGSIEAPVVAASLALTAPALRYGDVEPARDVAIAAVYDEGVLRLDRADLVWQGVRVSADGTLPAILVADYLPPAYTSGLPSPGTPARLTLRVDSLPPAERAPDTGQLVAGLDADVSGVLELEAARLDPSAVRGHLTLDRASLLLARVPFQQLEPTRMTVDNGRLHVEAFRWEGGGNELIMTGGAGFGGPAPALGLDVQGTLDLRMLSAFLPDVGSGGIARLQLSARGTPDEPDIEGSVTLEDVSLMVREPRVAVAGLSGTILLTGDRLTASGLTGSANGGTLTIGGEAAIAGLTLQDATLTIEGRRMAMALPNGVRAEIDADLSLLVPATTDPLLRGRVTVLRGAYREPISLADLAVGAVAGVTTAGLEPESFADRIRLDVVLVTAEDMRVENNYGRADVGATLRVLGTVGQPGLSGRATIREGGQVFLAGNTYAIEQSTIDFADAAGIVPDLNLRASTRIGGYAVTLAVSGTPDALEHDLQSDPPLPEADIVSVLVTGRTLSEAGGAQTDVAREQVLGYLSGDLLGFAGRAVGLDAIRLERGVSADNLPTDLALFAGDADPASRLTISKNLRRDVEIVLSQNLRQSGGLTWIAMYRPFDPIELRTISRDDNTRAYEFRHAVQFGRGVRTRGGRQRDIPAPRVAEVRFEGEPGFGIEQLQGMVDLAPGDRFDFFQWQRDQDRLEAFYHDQEYLEAAISATRETPGGAGDGPVTLVYRITRGPRTVLRVEGADLPGRLTRDMRAAWGRAVFDGFLFEDLHEAVRLHLARENYLQPRISVEIEQPAADDPPGRKTIVVRVDPGERTPGREVRFDGNRQITAAQLEAALAVVDLQEAVWIEPDAVAVAIERFYRSEGFLSADALVEAPVFEHARALRTIVIHEGPLFSIADIVVEGAAASSGTAVRQTAGLSIGSPYRASDVDEGRRRIEREYRRQGFNDVRVTAAALADPESAAVTVTFAVAEGPRQVIADIVLEGAETTRPHVILGNLQLEAGDPVDLDAWYQARRRLYDTNVFRSVDLDVDPLGAPSPESGTDQPVRARVLLEEWPRYRLRYGFQLNDEPAPLAEQRRDLSPGLVADIQDRNLLGRAASTGIAMRLQDDFRIARAFLGTPSFFGYRIRSGVFLTRSRQDFNQEGIQPFIEDTAGISLEQRLRPRSRLEVAYSYRLENKRTFDPDPSPLDPFPLDLRVRIGRFAGSVVSEHRDDPFDATRGWFHSSTVEYSPELFGSDLRFVKYLGQAYYFRPFGSSAEPSVLASAVRLGAGRGFGQDLIPSERFFAGGATSVRGYGEDSLGELDFFGDPRGGDALVLLNQEIRFPVFRWIRGVGFIDAGNVFPRAGDVSFGDLVVGMGAGLRVRTPVALVRVDVARGLSAREGQPGTRWYLSIGQAF